MPRTAIILGVEFTGTELAHMSEALLARNTTLIAEIIRNKGMELHSKEGRELLQKLAAYCANRLGRE